MITVDFKHRPNQSAVIIASGKGCLIVGNFIGRHGQKLVQVEYWDDVGVCHSAFFEESEIEQ